MFITKAFTGLLRKIPPYIQERINNIEEVPLALPTAMEYMHKIIHRDLPKDFHPPKDATCYYRYTGGAFVISSYKKQKVINCIVDNRCIHNGKSVKLFPAEF